MHKEGLETLKKMLFCFFVYLIDSLKFYYNYMYVIMQHNQLNYNMYKFTPVQLVQFQGCKLYLIGHTGCCYECMINN